MIKCYEENKAGKDWIGNSLFLVSLILLLPVTHPSLPTSGPHTFPFPSPRPSPLHQVFPEQPAESSPKGKSHHTLLQNLQGLPRAFKYELFMASARLLIPGLATYH